jgi:membrane-bound lytic murein transglycosylase A
LAPEAPTSTADLKLLQWLPRVHEGNFKSKGGTSVRRLRQLAAALFVIAIALSIAPYAAVAARKAHPPHSARSHFPKARPVPYPRLDWPFEIDGSQYTPVAWTDIPGWSGDDHLLAYKAFRASCVPIAGQQTPPADPKALGTSLREPCRTAKALNITDGARARTFFEEYFLPLRISRLGEDAGFVTGYYEPVIDGSRTQTDVYNVPVYRRPSNLFVRGFKQDSPSLPNKGQVFRKIGRRKLVPYYDRAEIEDGAIAGRGLEICWLKDQTDLLFAQIQGSARVRLEDGSTVRINYDAYNGYPYTAVGRILIDRGIIPKEQMSMQKIREWMDQNPDGARELRRQNRSYVFFHEVTLSDRDEAVGAQGVPLTPGRSIAVDKSLHVYGTPFFIEGELPIESEQSKTPFRRLMVAQDTGSAITGPARADIYYGAGPDAGRVSGRFRHNMRFAILVPKSLDPVARGRKMPLPDPRPSAKIARLFPQVDPLKDKPKDRKNGAKPSGTSAEPSPKSPVSATEPIKNATPPQPPAGAGQALPRSRVPLPEARPNIKPSRVGRHHRRVRHDRRGR